MSAIQGGVGGAAPLDGVGDETAGATAAASDGAAPSSGPAASSGDRLSLLANVGAPPADAGPGLDQGVVASIEDAMAHQSGPELAATITRASQQNPSEYRAALRQTLGQDLAGRSDLQKHLSMLDANNDGKVTLAENYNTLRDLKFSPLKAAAVAGASQLALEIATGGLFSGTINIANAGDAARHSTVDTGAFASNADLDAKVNELMASDQDGKGYITYDDISRYIDAKEASSDANIVSKTLTGAANKAEFQALFQLTGGKLTSDDLHDFFTGSLFYSLLPADSLAERLVSLRKS
jgi:hypothetical protein